MRKILILFCLALTAATCLEGQTLTVYPGDANNSRLCNHVDLLYLGLNFGSQGFARFLGDTTWLPQQVQAWGAPVLALDPAYSDCDGNGAVDRNDVTAIEGHFGYNTTPGTAPLPDTTSIGSVAGPHLIVDVAQDSIFIQDSMFATVIMNIQLGTANQPIDSLYGYAFTLDFDPLIVDAINFNFNNNPLIDSSALQFFRVDTTAGKIYVAACNIDHQNRVGFGTIATIGIVMDDDIRVNGLWNLFLTPTSFLGITNSAALVPVYLQADTLKIETALTPPKASHLAIYPNPATQHVSIASPDQAMTNLRLCNAQGGVVFENTSPNPEFEIINTSQFPAGCYFLEVRAKDLVLRRKLVIQSF